MAGWRWALVQVLAQVPARRDKGWIGSPRYDRKTAKLLLMLRDVPTLPLDAAQIDELKSTFGLDF